MASLPESLLEKSLRSLHSVKGFKERKANIVRNLTDGGKVRLRAEDLARKKKIRKSTIFTQR